ncbi:MAG: hypothetical protein HXY34_09365 [Candidatus Thorarchaeota archaeon]|nr:hypothetical protein [Candidatus Thorarchaeota archaeon]
MPDVVKCPYCDSSVEVYSSDNYDVARTMKCPNCGGTFQHIPGFGAYRPASGTAPPEGRTPVPPPTSRQWSGTFEGSTMGPPDIMGETRRKGPSAKEYDAGSECAKGCVLICGLCCLGMFALFMMAISMLMYMP